MARANTCRTMFAQPVLPAAGPDRLLYDSTRVDTMKSRSGHVLKMYDRLCGRRGQTVGLLSAEHAGMSRIRNVLSHNLLELNEAETEKLLAM